MNLKALSDRPQIRNSRIGLPVVVVRQCWIPDGLGEPMLKGHEASGYSHISAGCSVLSGRHFDSDGPVLGFLNLSRSVGPWLEKCEDVGGL